MATASEQQANVAVNPENPDGITMESVNRITKIPVIESTIQTATTIYSKVKDYNTITHWTLSTAENTVHKAMEVGKPITEPVVHSLEGPIKKVDEMICSGLDYVEAKVPALKLPPGEIYNSTKDYIDHNVTPKVQSAYHTVEPSIQTAKNIVEPAVQTAKNIVEPAVQTAKNIVEPAIESAKHMVEPAVQGALHMVEPVVQPAIDKVNEILHRNEEENAGASGSTETKTESKSQTPIECEECQITSKAKSPSPPK